MKTILVIDDDPTIIDVLRLFAAQIGYSCDAANSGEVALEKIANNTYWAVICDLQMPGLNGVELYDRIRERNPGLSDKFVLLTGSLLDLKTEHKVEECNIKVLMKPFHFKSIVTLFSAFQD